MNSDKGMECCGSCAFFQNEDITGNGWCGYHDTGTAFFISCRKYKKKMKDLNILAKEAYETAKANG